MSDHKISLRVSTLVQMLSDIGARDTGSDVFSNKKKFRHKRLSDRLREDNKQDEILNELKNIKNGINILPHSEPYAGGSNE